MKTKLNYSIDLLRRAEKLALRLDPENGFYLAFSGGKDSQVLYHVAKMAGVKFKAHMNLTSVDPPDLIRFVRKYYPDVELIKPKMSIYDMAKKKGLLPTKSVRWCCAEYKEVSGSGKVTLIGIRHSESARRGKRNEVETGHRKFSGNFDQWSKHEETMVTCVGGKDKIIISPIIHWTEKDVWDFHNSQDIPHCILYDKGYRRIGCLCCPMSSRNQKIKEIRDFPHIQRNWENVIDWLIKNKWTKTQQLKNKDLAFKWWISGKSFEKFYADEVIQYKLNL